MKPEENIETPQTKMEKISGQNESIVAFLILPIILTLLIPSGVLLYLFGRLNWHPGLLIMGYYPADIFMIVCFFVGIVRLLWEWKKYNQKGRLIGIAEVGVPIVFVVLFMIPPYVPIESPFWPGATPFTHGFRDRIQSKADILAIRSWLRTLEKEDYIESGKPLYRDKWPDSLRELKPPSIYLWPDKNDLPFVKITWGGAIFHWGLTISLKDMEISPSVLDDEYEAWLLVEPGVYVYDW